MKLSPKLADRIAKGLPQGFLDEYSKWVGDPTPGKPFTYRDETGGHISLNKTMEYGPVGLRIDSVAINDDVRMGDQVRGSGLESSLASKMLAYVAGTNPYPITIAGQVKNQDLFERMARSGSPIKYDAARGSALISDFPLSPWRKKDSVKRLKQVNTWDELLRAQDDYDYGS